MHNMHRQAATAHERNNNLSATADGALAIKDSGLEFSVF